MEGKSSASLIRKAEHAGSWYLNDPEKLNKQLSDFLAQAVASPLANQTDAQVKAIIGPHAGYRYSGPTAAWAYKNLQASKYKRVFLLGPSHKIGFDFIATTFCSEWATPLGNMEIDQVTIKELLGSGKDLF